jgi:hypothetical protein
MGTLPQVLEIIFEVQSENITRREISFPTYKTSFVFFGPFLL